MDLRALQPAIHINAGDNMSINGAKNFNSQELTNSKSEKIVVDIRIPSKEEESDENIIREQRLLKGNYPHLEEAIGSGIKTLLEEKSPNFGQVVNINNQLSNQEGCSVNINKSNSKEVAATIDYSLWDKSRIMEELLKTTEELHKADRRCINLANVVAV